jgi:hypothetical protein
VGCAKTTKDRKKSQALTVKDGLPNNTVVRIDEDEEGTVWIFTNVRFSAELTVTPQPSWYSTIRAAVLDRQLRHPGVAD